ncbi:MAG: MBL fold metallo-hydrolase [Desulfobulbaceae bacterium]|uniref:MBL fold metallo-hydrolase n=1 Tax=Candidatus Desulfatifera sulfidica TaxID=2841691 RepID=A0A8J6NAY3_9BACT|nr:MBL fold metallo-hydrolase [Candidatus Desulfatifera sulfidica]
MRFSVLGSGSKGNSVYIESGRTAVLIDAGFSGKEIERRLALIDRGLDDLDAILLTHEHNDHIQGAGILSRRCGLPLYITPGTLQSGKKRLGKSCQFVEIESGSCFEIQDLVVRSFAISHDCAEPVGFVVGNGRVSLGYCTDTGRVSHLIGQRLMGCEALVLEFNHDPELLKNGPYPLPLQQRVRSSQGHLSNAQAAEFLTTLLHEKLEQVVLAHLSETNNRSDLALAEIQKVLGEHESNFETRASTQEHPMPLITLGRNRTE